MKPIEMLFKHCEFENPYIVYVLLAVSRKKDTPEITNTQEIVFREVIKNERDIARKYNRLKAQILHYEDESGKKFPFYLYVSLNPRDSLKATFSLIGSINHWLQEEIRGVDNSKMFKKIYGHFYSALMKKESRAKSPRYFMLDYDQKDKLDEFDLLLKAFDIETVMRVETRNGYHYKVKPYDRSAFPDPKNKDNFNFESKIDANLFVEYFKNE